MNIINNMNDMECQSQDLENIINENSSQQRKLKDIIHIISALASITVINIIIIYIYIYFFFFLNIFLNMYESNYN